MKNIRLYFIVFICMLAINTGIFAQSDIYKKLSEIAEITKIEKMESDEFQEKYLTLFKQKISPKNDSVGTFQQRVVVFHAGFDRPTVIVTEGYGGNYALKSKYREEISRLFNTNMVFVEHRYFLESTPEEKDWQYLTAENSAEDLHAIVAALKNIYTQKWISTGISKGGQTALIYRTFFPDDVDISVPYVAPLCFEVEDGRHEPFLQNVSTAENRKKIEDFQLEVLKRREQLMPDFEKFCSEKQYEFSIPLDEIYDYCVLEHSFSFWQWGNDVEKIPANNASNDEIFAHFTSISSPSYFAKGGNTSFFVQAARELGYYGYDIEPFKQYLKIKNSTGYLKKIFLEGIADSISFDEELSKKIVNFLETNDPKIMFIYGEVDPWTAAGVRWLKGKRNIKILIQPDGSHRARISTLPEAMKNEAMETLTKWLEE
ncbi:MAG: aminopeptidase [Prevotellaceae bacterium]|nr:aminopeptidase [Prevotellaceae bacterium]